MLNKQINKQQNTVCTIGNKSVYYYDFWRSCDTEDWRYDTKLKFHSILKQKTAILNGNNIS